ncbi:MAG: lysine-sensitive aspartokinase 3 [Francisellaceae bacterium]
MQNEFIVAKFGGTSVANLKAINQCARIIKASPEVKIVVVSAAANITNLLTRLGKNTTLKTERKIAIDHIRAIVHPMLNALKDDELTQRIEALLKDLQLCSQLVERINNTQITDEILSFGERASALIVSSAFNKAGISSYHVDARTLIETDSRFSQAKPKVSSIPQKIKSVLNRIADDTIIITEGFIGIDSAGNTTTLGRGGSDYSAALLAAACSAKSLKIWTDVKGIYQVDPRIVPDAKLIDNLSFNEAAELATFGAKVLHPSTLWPAIRQNIRVFVGSTFEPETGGTWISGDNTLASMPIVRALARRQHQTLITIKNLNMFQTPGFLARLFTLIAQHHISIDLITTSEVSVALTIDHIADSPSHTMPISLELIEDIKALGDVELSIENELCLIAIIGNGLHQHSGIASRLFGCIGDINIRLINHGASGHNLCLLVRESDADVILTRIYDLYFADSAQHQDLRIEA